MLALDRSFWRSLHVRDPQIRHGDADDPIAGLVVLGDDDMPVEIVVGSQSWMRPILGRRMWVTVASEAIPVADAADLVLLKLYAGGPQDLLDAKLLVAHDPSLREVVGARLPGVPPSLGETWTRLAAEIP